MGTNAPEEIWLGLRGKSWEWDGCWSPYPFDESVVSEKYRRVDPPAAPTDGVFKDDPTWEDYQQNIENYRTRINAIEAGNSAPAAPNERNEQLVQEIIAGWVHTDSKEKYDFLSTSITAALATVRAEVWRDAVRVVTTKADELRQTEPFGTGVISASVQILEAIEVESARTGKTGDNQ